MWNGSVQSGLSEGWGLEGNHPLTAGGGGYFGLEFYSYVCWTQFVFS